MSCYGLLEQVEIQQEPTMGNYRIMFTQRGSCNDVCYNEFREFDNARNGYVKLNKHNQVMSFEMHGIQIDDHTDYDNVQMSTETLTLDIAK